MQIEIKLNDKSDLKYLEEGHIEDALDKADEAGKAEAAKLVKPELSALSVNPQFRELVGKSNLELFLYAFGNPASNFFFEPLGKTSRFYEDTAEEEIADTAINTFDKEYQS